MHENIVSNIKYIRTLKKDKDISFFHPLYPVKKQNKLVFKFKDTTPLFFIKKKLHLDKWAKECIYTFYQLPKIP